MLHPALHRELATAHIEDLHRAAAARHKVRLARRVAHAPHVAARPIAIVRSASTRIRGLRAPQADGMTPTEIPHAAPVGMPIRRRRSLIAGLKPRESQAGVRPSEQAARTCVRRLADGPIGGVSALTAPRVDQPDSRRSSG